MGHDSREQVRWAGVRKRRWAPWGRESSREDRAAVVRVGTESVRRSGRSEEAEERGVEK